jgi:mannose-6-phosphate isomerase-like protein (cupin superfamily)
MHSGTKHNHIIVPAGLLSLIFGLSPASLLMGQVTPAPTPARPAVPYSLRSAQAMGDLIRSLQAEPRTADILRANKLPYTVSVVSERAAAAAEFETHDTRDHIVLVLEGTTHFDLGGEAEQPRQVGPGDWRAATAKGTESVTLGKGDLLTIPRGTVHRRTTKESVVMLMISVSAAAPVTP